MSEVAATTGGGTIPPALEPGAILAGEFRLEKNYGAGAWGTLFRAVDQKSNEPVALRELAGGLLDSEELAQAVRQSLESTAEFEHKNLVRLRAVFGDGQRLFVVTESVDGQSLADVLAKKQQAGRPFSLKGAYNIIAHLCNACTHAHLTMAHGALHPGSVLVDKAGRVKIGEFGLVPPLLGTGRVAPAVGAKAQPYLAPEVRAGQGVDERSDVYSIGAILFALITNQVPRAPLPRASQLRPGVPAEIDAILDRCLADDPAARFPDALTLKHAVVDVMGRASEAPAASSAAPAPAADEMAFDIDIDETPEPAEDDPLGLFDSNPSDVFDVGSLMSEEDDGKEYLVSKRGLDYGPFNKGEVNKQIAAGEIGSNDLIVEVGSGSRIKAKSHPVFKDLLKEVTRRREAQRRALADASTQTVEKRQKRIMVIAIIAGIGVVVLGVASFLIYQEVKTKKKGPGERGSGDLSYQGDDEDPAKRRAKARKGRRWRGKRGVGGGGGPTGLDMEVGSVRYNFENGTPSGGETLSHAQLVGVISRRQGKLGACALKIGASKLRVTVQVRGNGRLAYARASPSSGTSCARRALSGLTFPKFNGTVTSGSYTVYVRRQ